MIFLNIVLDDSISSTEKTQMILEVLGNSKYRPSTAKYIRMNVSKLIDICGNEASRDEEQPNKLRYNFQKRLNKIYVYNWGHVNSYSLFTPYYNKITIITILATVPG